MSDWSSLAGGSRTKLKIIFLGDQSVGKSSIIDKYTKQQFVEGGNPTVGIDFHIKNVQWSGKNFRLQLWDTAGQERFRSLIPSYLKDANCGIFVFDVTKPKSLENLHLWEKMFDQYAKLDVCRIVVGNKVDLQAQRKVNEETAKQHAEKLQGKYIEVSAKDGMNIVELFDLVIEGVEQMNKVSLPMISQGENEKPSDRQPPKPLKINAKTQSSSLQTKKENDKCC